MIVGGRAVDVKNKIKKAIIYIYIYIHIVGVVCKEIGEQYIVDLASVSCGMKRKINSVKETKKR